MKRYRILFCLWLAFLIGIWIFGSSNSALYAAAATLVCLIPEAIIAFSVRRNAAVSLSAPVSAAKAADVSLTVTVHNAAMFGASRVRVKLRLQNLLTGESENKTVWLAVDRQTKADALSSFVPSHCGKISVTAEELDVFDAFGFFCLKKPVSENTAVLILPQIYPIQISIGQHSAQDPDSAEYSMLRAGNDPGETFALREYRPGDRIRDIHWKLSEKTDRLTVREYGLPVNNTILILYDNICTDGGRTADMCENIGESTVSFSAALCEAKLPHDIGLYDAEKRSIVLIHITGEDDLNASLSDILSAQPTADSLTVTEHLCEQYDPSCFAHVLVVTDRGQDDRLIGNTVFSYLEPPKEKENVYAEI